jgi:3-methyladenine DNA glycosylase/8-oxoguanine DNA glycosylase
VSTAVDLRVEVRPPWPFRLPRYGGLDGLTQIRSGVIHRLLHRGEKPVVVRVAQPAANRVLLGAQADDEGTAEWGIERMRLALGVDQNLAAFHDRFRFDPVIGAAVRSDPWLRVYGRPEPFEALMWAICEQLIEFERAAEIQRRLTRRLGRRCQQTGLRDAPNAAAVAAQAPAWFESLGISGMRSIALVRAAREVSTGRVDLFDADHERGWRRLRSIRGIGSWTTQKLALTGQGRLDQLPAGDLAFMKLVGRLRTGHPKARANEEEVAEFFLPYEPWAGLAGIYALRSSNSTVSKGALASASWRA